MHRIKTYKVVWIHGNKLFHTKIGKISNPKLQILFSTENISRTIFCQRKQTDTLFLTPICNDQIFYWMEITHLMTQLVFLKFAHSLTFLSAAAGQRLWNYFSWCSCCATLIFLFVYFNICLDFLFHFYLFFLFLFLFYLSKQNQVSEWSKLTPFWER